MVAELKHQGMSEAIGSSLRSNDSAYPLRKLDFICLLSDLDSEISSIIGERIRKKISERKFGCNGAQQLSINPLMITIDRHEVTSFESFHNLLEKMLKPNGVNEKIPYPPSHKLQEQPVCFNPNQARQAESLIQCRTSD
jgi:hypothetical protein